MFPVNRVTWLLLGLFLLGALLKPVAADQSQAHQIEVSPQYGASAVSLYLVDETGQYLIPVSRRVPAAEQNDPRRALEALIAGPQAGPELRAVLLPQTRLLDFEVVAGTARVNLAAPAFATDPPRQAIDALRFTLTEFPSITAVELALDGQPVDAQGNLAAQVTPLPRPAAINSTEEPSGQAVTMYYGYGPDRSMLAPVTRYLPVGANLIEQAMQQLLAGPPPGSGLISVIPADVHLLKAGLEQGVAFVDLSEELVYAYRLKQANALQVRKAVIATLTSLPGVYAGSIEIGGSALLYFSCQNVVMERPQAKPWAINDEFYLAPLTPHSLRSPSSPTGEGDRRE
ncbi:MAG: GerMN domain-containing protein [Chloroflexota bacterium]